ncbi:hypothetical protein [Erythrobacter oryzae]|uniref:hypothetical protein n=1 Tax=Erythrobacter oryzae TaxID=3019556 RepID=UPI00255364B3|nr:hypothetical protein [Erythrobacter sp. COR-2]
MNSLRIKALALALLAAGTPALPLAAQGTPPPPPDNIEAAAGELRVIHLWSTEPDEFMAAWAGPTPPKLPTSKRMERNQPIQQFVLYANCTRNAAGECHVTAKVLIFAPDGSAYGDPLAFEVVNGPATVPPGNIGMASGGIGLTVEDGEQLGRYRVELVVTDHNAGLTATSVVHLEAVEAGSLAGRRKEG